MEAWLMPSSAWAALKPPCSTTRVKTRNSLTSTSLSRPFMDHLCLANLIEINPIRFTCNQRAFASSALHDLFEPLGDHQNFWVLDHIHDDGQPVTLDHCQDGGIARCQRVGGFGGGQSRLRLVEFDDKAVHWIGYQTFIHGEAHGGKLGHGQTREF